jgi:hypothetical protein
MLWDIGEQLSDIRKKEGVVSDGWRERKNRTSSTESTELGARRTGRR